MNKKNILIMGNGSSVLDNKWGEYIDNNFDIIFRINRYKTEGYEEYVGNKTNFWVVHDGRLELITDNMVNKYSGGVIIFCPKHLYNGFISKFNSYINKNINPNNYHKVILIPGGLELNYFNNFLKNKFNYNYLHITTGLGCILWVLKNYSKEEYNIIIHGFDHMDRKYEFYHYYDIGNNKRLTSKHWEIHKEHNPELEKKYIDQLINNKILIRLENILSTTPNHISKDNILV